MKLLLVGYSITCVQIILTEKTWFHKRGFLPVLMPSPHLIPSLETMPQYDSCVRAPSSVHYQVFQFLQVWDSTVIHLFHIVFFEPAFFQVLSSKTFQSLEYWPDLCMQIWVTITCSQSTWFQVKPWLYFLLLQPISGMPVYRINSNHYLARWRKWITGFQSRRVGLNFGWILQSPWELKNHQVPGPHPRKIKLELLGVGPRHHSFLNYTGDSTCNQRWNSLI